MQKWLFWHKYFFGGNTLQFNTEGMIKPEFAILSFLGCHTIHCTRGNLKKHPLFYSKMTILTQIFSRWKYTSDQYRRLLRAKMQFFIFLWCLTIHYTHGNFKKNMRHFMPKWLFWHKYFLGGNTLQINTDGFSEPKVQFLSYSGVSKYTILVV